MAGLRRRPDRVVASGRRCGLTRKARILAWITPATYIDRDNAPVILQESKTMKLPAFRRSIFAVTVAWLVAAGAATAAERQRQLWVTNAYGNDIHVFDVATWKLIRRIECGPNPHGISATADGRTVHVALEDFQSQQGELIWIDAVSGETRHRVKVGPKPNENECTPDGKWIYVPCDDGQYWVVDGEKHHIATKIRTGGRPHNTVISPDAKLMYLSPMGNPKRVTIVDEIPFGHVARPPAISGDGKRFYQNIDGLLGFQVADIQSRKVINTVTHRIADQYKATTSRSHGLGVRPDQKEIWSCNVEHETVHIHDLTNGQFDEVATLKMPGRIYWVSFTPDSRYGIVSVRSAQKVAIIDCQTKKIERLLDVGREPKRTQVIDVPVVN
jgi:DNA-binding beta-propeller fold protein YncE